MSKGVFGSIVGMMAVALLMLSGCGGGGDSGPLTKAEYVRMANTICNKGLQEREEFLEKYYKNLSSSSKPTRASLEEAILTILKTYERATAKLAELEPPAGEEKKAKGVIALREEAAERVRANPETAIESSLPFAKATDAAEAYGLTKNCHA